MLTGGHHQELAAAAATIVDGIVPVLESSFANQVEFSVACRPRPSSHCISQLVFVRAGVLLANLLFPVEICPPQTSSVCRLGTLFLTT